MHARVSLGQTVIGPGQVRPVTASTAEDFILDGGTLAPTNVTLSGSINLASPSAILRPQNPTMGGPRGNPFETSTGPTHLNSPISGSGDLTLGNASRDQLFINGHNDYTGHTYITAGNIIAATPQAFGSPAGSTTIQGGLVRVNTETNEQFRVEGGQLIFIASAYNPSAPITLAGGEVRLPNRDLYQTPIAADGGGTLGFSSNESASWTGGSSGAGNLRLSGRVSVDAPLTHDGDLIIAGARLNVPNSYTGKTTIVGSYVIDRGDVFGTAISPIEVDDGDVTVQVLPQGNRGFAIKRGTLNVQTAEPVNAGITLGGGFEAVLRGVGLFNGPIDYVTVQGGGYAHIQGGVFNGPIRGDTLLRLGGAEGVTLNAANEIDGLVHVTGGKVVVNHEDGLPLPATLVQGGIVELDITAAGLPIMNRYPYGNYGDNQTGTLKLNADQHFTGLTYAGEGKIETAADVQFDRLLARNTQLAAVDQGSVTINDELMAVGTGAVSGKLKGDGAVRLLGTRLGIGGDLSEFNGDFVVERGTLDVTAAGSLGAGDFVVTGSGTLDFGGYFTPARTVDNTIVLQNDYRPFQGSDAGIAYSEYGGGPLTIAGRIDVGAHGGAIVGSSGIHVQGSITGRSLMLHNSSLTIKSPQDQLEVLTLLDSSVSIDDSGSLQGLDAVYLDSGSLYLGPSANTDRLGDSVPIHSNSGIIQLVSDGLTPTSEVIGVLHVDAGHTGVFNSSDHGSLAATLTFDRVERQPGALLNFNEAGRVTNTCIQSVDMFDDAMIGAWAVTDDGFASRDASGIVRTLQPTASSINAAGPADHVSAPGAQSLTADRVVASLNNPPTGSPYSLDLNGHKLTVRSGGVFSSGDIHDGVLTAGDGGPAELIVYQTSRIDANVTDNGPDGSVALVTTNHWGLTLAGANTYTGGTWVVGDSSPYYADRAKLVIKNLEAIPEDDRVYLEFGHYELLFDAPTVVELAELHVRNNSYVTGGNATIDADAYYFQHGQLGASLTGDGTIYKDSGQRFDFNDYHKSPDFTGDLYLRDGALRLYRDSLPNASLFVEGGRLEVGDQYNLLGNSVVLDGGELIGRYGGAIHVASDSSLYHSSNYTALFGSLSGDGDLTVRGPEGDYYAAIFGDASAYTGDLHVESGALRVGASSQLGAGEIFVGEGAQLALGSSRVEDGPTIVSRDVHVTRGTVYTTPPYDSFESDRPNGVITGDVYVHDFAFLGASSYGEVDNHTIPGLVLAGGVILDDGALVIGKSPNNAVFFSDDDVPRIEIAGALDVGAENVWRLELASVGVTGAIRARAPQASIDFQGVASALNLQQATIMADAGHSLSITVNGESRDLQLDDDEARLAGGGVLEGGFVLSDGATVAPGSSPGQLSIAGDLELGPGAVYEWEIDDPAAGPGVGWDLLAVQDDLMFTATPESPWILEIIDLGHAIGLQPAEWLIATATTIDGFDPAAVQVTMGDSTAGSQPSLASAFSVEQRGADLYLVHNVPEPATSAHMVVVGLILLAYRGRRADGNPHTGFRR